MLAIGVDLISVNRIEKAIDRHGQRFLDRVFTPQERKHCADNPHRLAARWAAKEAVAKALGTGIGDITWQEIEVHCNHRGQPHIRLHGAASRLAESQNIAEISVSLSHDGGQAIAFVVGLRQN